jgi:hypothetical protein
MLSLVVPQLICAELEQNIIESIARALYEYLVSPA